MTVSRGSSLHHLPTIDVSELPSSLLGTPVPLSSSSSSSSSTSSSDVSSTHSASQGGGDASPFPSLSSLQDAVSNQISDISNNRGIIPPTLPTCMAAGTLSFYSTLALSTLLQGKILRLSTGSMPPVPTIAGIATVAVGGLAAHGTSVVVTALQRNERNKKRRRERDTLSSSSWWRQSMQQPQQSSVFADFVDFDRASQALQTGVQSIETDVRSFAQALSKDPAHAVRIAALALITFKVLGGRFWSIPPSSYTNLGSFARVSHSIPAKMDYATSAQRKVIESVGRKWGCHTCGSRMIFSRTRPSANSAGSSVVKFHADHMPPKSVAHAMNSRWWRRLLRIQVKQRFYPQCVSCSNVQGSILSKAASQNGAGGVFGSKANGARALAASGGGSAAYNHGFRLRFYHVTGGLVAAATVADANENEVVRNGNAKRFRLIQDQIGDAIGSLVDFCCDWIDSFH